MALPQPTIGYNPQELDPASSVGRIMQLRNLSQAGQLQQEQLQTAKLENQQRQMAVQSQTAIQKAYMDAQGDPDKTVQLAAQYGARPVDLLSLRSTMLKQKADTLDLVAKQGTVAKQQADLMQGAHDQLAAMDPSQRAQAYPQILAQLQQSGLDTSKMPPQYPGDAAFNAIGVAIKSHSQQVEEALKQSELTKNTAQAGEATAKGAEAQANADFAKQFGSPKGTPEGTQFTLNYLQANNLPNTPENRLKAQKEYINQTKIKPAEVRLSGLMAMPIAVADPNNPGQTIMVPRKEAAGMAGPQSASVIVPKKEAEYMTSGAGGKQLTAFNTAIQHLDLLDKLGQDLNNTNIQIFNRAKQAWAEQTGNPAPANFAAAKNAMAGEVASALKASGATDQEIREVGTTFNRAQSPAQLSGAIGTYKSLLYSKAQNLRKQYESGMQGKPNFGSSGSGLSVTAPNGKTYTFKDQQSLDNFKKAAGIQ